MKLHPQILEKEGKREFFVLPFEEYETLTNLVEDYEDLRACSRFFEKKGQKSQGNKLQAGIERWLTVFP